mmetsp:Transcript_48110/g.133682  ORF Transcript_48110/g.133682 Transcript_48110/m.133682 type:complete len:262 (-) Transcript_48110:995-1780(-)
MSSTRRGHSGTWRPVGLHQLCRGVQQQQRNLCKGTRGTARRGCATHQVQLASCVPIWALVAVHLVLACQKGAGASAGPCRRSSPMIVPKTGARLVALPARRQWAPRPCPRTSGPLGPRWQGRPRVRRLLVAPLRCLRPLVVAVAGADALAGETPVKAHCPHGQAAAGARGHPRCPASQRTLSNGRAGSAAGLRAGSTAAATAAPAARASPSTPRCGMGAAAAAATAAAALVPHGHAALQHRWLRAVVLWKELVLDIVHVLP